MPSANILCTLFLWLVLSVDGTCYNIAKGSRRLDFRIARCPNYADTDGHTGYLQGRQLIVMEIVPRTQAACKLQLINQSGTLVS